MVIGIDAGYGMTKTKNITFASAVAELPDKQCFNRNVIEFKDRVYQVGTNKIGLTSDKTLTDDYYLLTLAGVAEELKALDPRVTAASVTLALGVPLMRYAAEKTPLINYIKERGSDIKFVYEGENYNIHINDDIYVYPQGYAAIAEKLTNIKYSFYLVDIGTGTTDILSVGQNFVPDLANSHTIQYGINNLIADINETISSKFNTKIKQDKIIDIILGNTDGAMPKIVDIVNSAITKFIDSIVRLLRENNVNYEFEPTFFVGGGAGILKKYGSTRFADCNVSFIDDIRANAKGYEILAKKEIYNKKR